MLTKIYAALWVVFFLLALILFLTGSMTMMALVVFGFVAFGLTFMGMMGVLPATVVHAHHVVDGPVAEAKEGLRDRIRGYKETLTAETLAVRKPKFP